MKIQIDTNRLEFFLELFKSQKIKIKDIKKY